MRNCKLGFTSSAFATAAMRVASGWASHADMKFHRDHEWVCM
ncbi:MAG: hypothetical protein R3F19_02270 [Verrucomicrobiales bacterium]